MDKVTEQNPQNPQNPFPILVETYHDHTIHLTSSFRFEVEGPYFRNDQPRIRTFDALTDAKAEISKRHTDRIKEDAMAMKIKLDLITDKGEHITVTRINRTTSDIGGKEAQGYKVLYPDVPGMLFRLTHRAELKKALDLLDEDLKKCQVKVSRHWGQIDLETLPHLNKELQAEYDAAKEAALRYYRDQPKPDLKAV